MPYKCNAGGCLVELSQQLAIIMVGKQIINNAQEILWPKLQAWWQNRKVNFNLWLLLTKGNHWKILFFQVKLCQRAKNEQVKQWEEDYQLVDNAGLFDEYLEMGIFLKSFGLIIRLIEHNILLVVQFGFITVFVAAFPLAPLFALINNIVEIRLDARKFICSTRRPVGQQAKNIGIWFSILEVLAHLAVISNVIAAVYSAS